MTLADVDSARPVWCSAQKSREPVSSPRMVARRAAA
jgi:hypothetical protein